MLQKLEICPQPFFATNLGSDASSQKGADCFISMAEVGAFVFSGVKRSSSGPNLSALAAQTAAAMIKKYAKPSAKFSLAEASSIVKAAIEKSSEAVFEKRDSSALKPARLTLDVIWRVGPYLVLGHVGNNRVYLVRGEAVEILTTDHTFAATMQNENVLSSEEASKRPYANELSQSIGQRNPVQVEVLRPELQDGDRILLCNPGVYQNLSEQALLRESSKEFREKNELGKAVQKIAKGEHASALLLPISLKVRVIPSKRSAHFANGSASPEMKMHALKNSPFFSLLTFIERTRLLEIATPRNYSSGEVLANLGDIPDRMWVLISGKVRISQGGFVVAIREAGTTLGESVLLAQEPRSATITAEGSVHTLEFEKEKLIRLIEGYMNNTAARIYRAIATFEHYRTTELTKQLAETMKAKRSSL